MKKHPPLVEENKKRAAFKRFSQMSAAGLAVISMSAFTSLSAKQLPANVETDFANKQNLQLQDSIIDKPLENDTLRYKVDNYYNTIQYPDLGGGGDDCDYVNYYNYSNYSNSNNNYNNNYSDNYSDNYTNNYSNYSDSAQ